MFIRRKLIFVFIMIGLFVSCNKDEQQAKSMKIEIDTTALNSNSDYRLFIKVADNADYRSDFKTSIEKGDYRFVGVMGFALITPGVPDYDEKYEKSNSVKIIEGTTDSYEDSVALRIAVFKNEYATSYNKLLLEYLSKDEE